MQHTWATTRVHGKPRVYVDRVLSSIHPLPDDTKLQNTSNPTYNAVTSAFISSCVGPLVTAWYALIKAGDDELDIQASHRHALYRAMAEIGTFMLYWDKKRPGGTEAGGLLHGARISAGDTMIWPWIPRLVVQQAYRGVPANDTDLAAAIITQLGEEVAPAVDRFFVWKTACAKQPAVLRTTAEGDAEHYIEAFSAFRGRNAQRK